VLPDPSCQAWLEKFHLRWVAHALSINQKSQTMSYSKFILTILMEQKASGFQWIIIGDAGRFFVGFPRKEVWAA
jgi:hypothetical protein